MDSGDDSWLLNTFVLRFEQHCPDLVFEEASALSEDMLNQILLSTTEMNSGVNVMDHWYDDDITHLVIPLSDITWRLNRFLDTYTYTPEETERYDFQRNAIQFDLTEVFAAYDVTPTLALLDTAFLDGQTVKFTIENSDTNHIREYTIRFDADSWRYLSITQHDAP